MELQKKIIIIVAVVLIAGLACGTYWFMNRNSGNNGAPEGLVCTQEALQCPDGSYVARTGPHCSFAACPSQPSPTGTLGEIGIGKSALINGVQVTLNKIIQDSRCPVDVQCVQAGWVTANVTLQSGTDKETVDIASNAAPVAFGAYQVSIESINPPRVSTAPKPENYSIAFRVRLKVASSSLPAIPVR